MTNAEITRQHLSCAETAKLVRKALKTAFPDVKFSVRAKTYAGGASISIGYTDGPCSRAVEDAVGRFRAADFDGMTDMKSYRDSVLLASEDGSYEEVSYGADFISAQRTISDDVQAELLAEIEAVLGHEPSWGERLPVWVEPDGSVGPLVGEGEWLDTILYRMSVRREMV